MRIFRPQAITSTILVITLNLQFASTDVSKNPYSDNHYSTQASASATASPILDAEGRQLGEKLKQLSDQGETNTTADEIEQKGSLLRRQLTSQGRDRKKKLKNAPSPAFSSTDGMHTALRDFCAVSIANYTTVPGDTAISIVTKFYAESNHSLDLWGGVVMCNENLQDSYGDFPRLDELVPSWLTLSVPNTAAVVQYLANYTASLYHQLGLPRDSNCGCTPSKSVQSGEGIFMVASNILSADILMIPNLAYASSELIRCNPKVKLIQGKIQKSQMLNGVCDGKVTKESSKSMKQSLGTEGFNRRLYKFDPNDGQVWCNQQSIHKAVDSEISGYPDCFLQPHNESSWWNYYTCLPSYSYDSWATITIITGDDPICQSQWERAVDGCSVPISSPFTHDFTAACNKHDTCYWFSYRAGQPYSVDQRRICDQSFRSDMNSICDWLYSDWWNGATKALCYSTASVWFLAVWNEQESGTFPPYHDPYSTTPINSNPGYLYRVWKIDDWRLPGNIQYMRAFRSDAGNIRSMMNGKCIDANDRNFGRQLWMYDCHGWEDLENQVFVRPSPTDLRLQLMNTNLCLDAYAFGGPGGEVVLYTCNDENNQKWVYTPDQQLIPLHNVELCLDINGANNDNLATLIVWWCNGENKQKWSLD